MVKEESEIQVTYCVLRIACFVFTCVHVYVFTSLHISLYTRPMGLTLESIYLLLFIATLVAIVTQRAHIPYTAGLVIAGIAVSFLPFTPRIELSKDLIFIVLLPPLIFEATLFIRWRVNQSSGRVFFSTVYLLVENNISSHAG